MLLCLNICDYILKDKRLQILKHKERTNLFKKNNLYKFQ